MLADVAQRLLQNNMVMSKIFLRIPLAHGFGIGTFMHDEAHDQLGGLLVRGAVEGDGSDRVAAKTFLRLLLQRFLRSIREHYMDSLGVA